MQSVVQKEYGLDSDMIRDVGLSTVHSIWSPNVGLTNSYAPCVASEDGHPVCDVGRLWHVSSLSRQG